MEMSSTIIALSLAIASLGLNAAAAVCWFPLWRKKKSGTAQALFLITTLLSIGIALRVVQIVCYIINGIDGVDPFNLAVGFTVFFAAVIQFALSRGYFTVRSR